MARNSDMSWEIRIRKLGERRAAARHKPEDGGARTALHGTHTIHTMHSVSSKAIVTVAHACTKGGAEAAIVGLARPERGGGGHTQYLFGISTSPRASSREREEGRE